MPLPPTPHDEAALPILVVEDEALIALDVEFILRGAGFGVIGPTASVSEACRLVREEAPAAAILDVNLGTEQVFPVADMLAARKIPFLFTSGYDAGILPPRHARRPLVLKPCRAEQLIEFLTAALDTKSRNKGQRHGG